MRSPSASAVCASISSRTAQATHRSSVTRAIAQALSIARTRLVESLVRGLMRRKMIVDMDHMDALTAGAVLDIGAAQVFRAEVQATVLDVLRHHEGVGRALREQRAGDVLRSALALAPVLQANEADGRGEAAGARRGG